MRSPFLTGLICLTLALGSAAFAWDGRWTNAVTGNGDVIYDPDTSHGQAGTKERPQTFYTPPPREFQNVDPEELSDYFDRYNKEYAPYALARISQSLRYNGAVLPKGYYLVKPGNETDGSPRVGLISAQPAPVQMPAVQSLPALESITGESVTGVPAEAKTNDAGVPGTDVDGVSLRLSPAQPVQTAGSTGAPSQPVYRVFVIKRLGQVVAVVPIHRMQVYKPKRKEKVPRQALAWVEMEERHPVLKFYYKQRIYSTDFQ